MKKYSFSLTNKEVVEFSIRAAAEQMRLQITIWLLLVLICVMDMFVVWWMGTFFIFCVFSLIIVNVMRTYKIAKESLCEKMRTMWVENGMLITASETFHEEMPCDGVQVIRRTRNLLMLGHYQSKKRLAWYVIPLRIFSSKQEADEFVGIIHNPQANYNQKAACNQQGVYNAQEADGQQAKYSQQMADSQQTPGGVDGYDEAAEVLGETGKELLHFNFWIEESRWKQVCIDTTEIIRSGIMGNNNKAKILWIIFAVAGVPFLYTCITGGNIIIMSCLFMMLFLVTAILNNISGNPEKLVKKQLKRGILHDNVYGNWDISIAEEGVTWSSPREGRGFMSWDKISWIIEKEATFYLFWEDKKHFVMILKESLGGYERYEELKRICAEKSVKYAVGKKVKYISGWISALIIFFIIVIYLNGCIKVGIADGSIKNSGSMYGYDDVTYEQYEEIDVTDYPDYVTLDSQVKFLRSYGFTISDEIVETAQDSMDEYEHMRIYIEGYPYTWLLTQIGAPARNDEWEITGYSDEVFWFDFEGWDISTDYITVLEGMLSLAQGSAINSVSNIREDTSAVDWDKGTGSIDVVLEWNGEEYQWTMDMNYDWIDEKVLGILNELLDKTDEEERFYVTGDNGQGAIIFYRDSEWAKDFEKDTGLELSVCK